MKNLFKITDAKIVIAFILFFVGLFTTAAVVHPGGQPKKYSDYSENAIHGGWSADRLTK
ncbi:hypothetical protein [uncultured Chryseobacterium sp.]|uniref:hypothetical protein n=1 Tax=uncultured Chryseobacterium sp. TaxID=259322 RepID=UPI0025E3E8A8|nr:hypothetical protein [uncultured Chryseobacterium sp.]